MKEMINKVYNEDCLETMKRMEDNSVDLTVTSPPYDNLRTYNNNTLWNRCIWEQVISNLFKITKDFGVVVWIVGDATIKGNETMTSFKQALYFNEVGFNLHDTMIYQKVKFSPYDPRNKRYKQQFEYMFIFSKGKPRVYNPIKDVKNKYAGLKFKGRHGRTKKDDIRKPSKHYKTLAEFQDRSNIWKYSQEGGVSEHPAPFPKKLAEDHILSWSNEGDLVYDPFMGSGTTAVCSKILNRKYIGSEIDKDYYEIVQKRLKQVQGRLF